MILFQNNEVVLILLMTMWLCMYCMCVCIVSSTVCVGLTWSSIPMRLCLWSSEREGCDESALMGYPGYPLGNVCTGNPGATQ